VWEWVRDEVDTGKIYWRIRRCKNCHEVRRYIIRASEAWDPVPVTYSTDD
jgi:hypothetical protein